jgi:hypothetical protein
MSFFKQVYRRYTNFAVQTTDELFSTTVQFGTKNINQLSKNGDLAGNMSFRITLPNLGISGGTWAQTIGYNIFSLVRMRIGDVVVQAQESVYMDIDDKLFCPSEKYDGLSQLVKRDEVLTTDQSHDLIVPLKFFNCYRPGKQKQQYLPILNLDTNKEVFIEIVLKPLSTLVTLPTGAVLPNVFNVDAGILVDYVYLDETERFRFAQQTSRVLIEQTSILDVPTYLTTTGGDTVQQTEMYVQLKELTKPCKYFAVVALDANDFTNFTYHPVIRSGTFYINSDQQFQPRSGVYWNLVQPYQHFTRSNLDNINCFSFALDASSFQPNGFLNFASYVRTALRFEIEKQTVPMRLKIHCVCLNWIDFLNGSAVLAFN